MTLPAERTRAVTHARQLLLILARGEPISISGLVQSAAYAVLQHFPRDVDIAASAASLPRLWAFPKSSHPKHSFFTPLGLEPQIHQVPVPTEAEFHRFVEERLNRCNARRKRAATELRQIKELHMPVWNIAPVAEEPSVTLRSWRIFQTNDGSRHFVGEDARDGSGRVSSEIVVFDCERLRGTTVSGRVYQLVDCTGLSLQADYVWERWCSVNGVESSTDVSSEVSAGAEVAAAPQSKAND
ncbi:BPSL0761 family protein [Paraburkholderia tropica]|uniref:BPSL0761 family protein n=1 Tax=Paraburkholderia tropica TaxID=92647 RepID=UPI002ABE7744|nr:BPSL0761 family protein [Paraburkholderia tropica]